MGAAFLLLFFKYLNFRQYTTRTRGGKARCPAPRAGDETSH